MFTLFLSAVFAKRPTCSEELESALYRPVSRGNAYFLKLKCDFPSKFAKFNVFSGFNPDVPSVETGSFCNQYQKENAVIVNLYNVFGQNLCILKNPLARALAPVWTLLNTKTADQRFSIYNELNTVGLLTIPPSSDPDMDFFGISATFYNFTVESFLNNYDPLPAISRAIEYIQTTYPNVVPQNQADLDNVNVITHIVFALDPVDEQAFYNQILNSKFSYAYRNSLDYNLISLSLVFGLAQQGSATFPPPLSQRLLNYASIEAQMKSLMTNPNV